MVANFSQNRTLRQPGYADRMRNASRVVLCALLAAVDCVRGRSLRVEEPDEDAAAARAHGARARLGAEVDRERRLRRCTRDAVEGAELDEARGLRARAPARHTRVRAHEAEELRRRDRRVPAGAGASCARRRGHRALHVQPRPALHRDARLRRRGARARGARAAPEPAVARGRDGARERVLGQERLRPRAAARGVRGREARRRARELDCACSRRCISSRASPRKPRRCSSRDSRRGASSRRRRRSTRSRPRGSRRATARRPRRCSSAPRPARRTAARICGSDSCSSRSRSGRPPRRRSSRRSRRAGSRSPRRRSSCSASRASSRAQFAAARVALEKAAASDKTRAEAREWLEELGARK